jgi:NAD(P)-dependent dehydrogenase (short-subunit alcohol dehydrogenase family)
MLPQGNGTIIFTGATASVRGGPAFAAFAAAKFGERAVAQSMAREVGPQGIHISSVIIDGGIDMPEIRRRYAAAGESDYRGRAAGTQRNRRDVLPDSPSAPQRLDERD